MKGKVVERVRYAYHNRGEDMAFCLNTKENAFEVRANSSVVCDQVMHP